MNAAQLAEELRALVLAQDFGATEDHHHGGAPVAHFPSIDLAVAAFPRGQAPVYANVLFSRWHPEGIVATIAPQAGSVGNLRYLRDFTDAQFESPAWVRGADWEQIAFDSFAGSGALRHLEPYPASLVKIMVAVGIARQDDLGRLRWDDWVEHAGQARSIANWCEAMITESCNIATEALVKALHESGAIVRGDAGESHNEVEQRLHAFGLSTLFLTDTKANGGWRIPDGAGVGHLCMTAWDAVRLFWLLDAQAPRAPWLGSDEPLLSPRNTARLYAMLERQGLHIMLSSAALAGLPDFVPGLPAQLPAHWIRADGSVQVAEGYTYPADVRAERTRAQVMFAHKTGGTDNYCSDAGIVRGLDGRQRHYVVAILTNLGKRYGARPHGIVNWRLPALGRAVDELMASWLEN